jgi:hypothetical protein
VTGSDQAEWLTALIEKCRETKRPKEWWDAWFKFFMNDMIPLYKRHNLSIKDVEERWPVMASLARDLMWLKIFGVLSHHEARKVLKAGFQMCLDGRGCLGPDGR